MFQGIDSVLLEVDFICVQFCIFGKQFNLVYATVAFHIETRTPLASRLRRLIR